MRVSVILTVLNEADNLPRLLDSLAAQTRPADEVVVVDGGSSDGTVVLLNDYAATLPLTVTVVPGASISQGRNAAIAAASGDVVAATDAGVWLDDDWLAELTAPFAAADAPSLVAGFFASDPRTPFEVALGATTLPTVDEIDIARFLPSSRSVAYTREVWQAVGGYPEWLDFSEDVVFDLRVRAHGGAFGFAPQAIAHFRPRASLTAFARQYFNYASGDGKANLWPRIHFVRYFTYLVAAPLGLYIALAVSPWFWLAGVVAGLAYIRTPLRRLTPQWQGLTWGQRLYALALVPLIRVVGDMAKMVGYPVGWRWRLLNHPPDWRVV